MVRELAVSHPDLVTKIQHRSRNTIPAMASVQRFSRMFMDPSPHLVNKKNRWPAAASYLSDAAQRFNGCSRDIVPNRTLMAKILKHEWNSLRPIGSERAWGP